MTTQCARPALVCRLLSAPDFSAWDRFVAQHPQASVYHLSVWRQILAAAFGKSWYLLAVVEHGDICAGIPLVHLRHPLFGNFLVSLPYVNYGGLLAASDLWAEPLLQQAILLSQQLGARHIELRHLTPCYPHLPVSTEKVSMCLALPDTAAELFASFKAKLRSQVRKGEKNGLGVRIGGTELLEDFYTVFVRNMRDHGTPVYSRTFFRLILEAFPDTARLVVVTSENSRPLASGFLLGYRDRLEIPWASSLREYNHLQSNMWLYWQCLQYACEHGYRIFDFGRSAINSPTFKFKAQWGTQPVQHFWHYHLAAGEAIPRLNPHNPKFRFAVKLWQHLPLPITRWLGPAIVKHLP
jgi:serine/alanine adding enzyme